MYRRSFIELLKTVLPICITDYLPSFVKMVAFWAEMGVAYLEMNKLQCLHEIDIPKYINVWLSLPNNVRRLIVFAPFLLLIIIIIFSIRLLLLFLSFRGTWTCPRHISGTTGQDFMKLGGVIDICFFRYDAFSMQDKP